MKNPIGMVYKINDKWNRDQAVAYSKAAQHYTTTSIDDFELAQRLKAEAGVTYSIYRNTTWEPGNLKGQSEATILAEAVKAYAAIRDADRRVHILINNEQEWSNERFLFYIGLVNEALADRNGPVGMVFGNFASGSIKSGQGDDPNWFKTTPNAGDFFRLLEDNVHVKLPDGTQAFIWGIHEYTALFPWAAANGGEYIDRLDWENAAPKIDWSKPQWHLGRNRQGLLKAGLPVPYMIVTEALFDDMRDVVDAWTVRHPGSVVKPRGYKTLKDFWKAHGYAAPVGKTYQQFLEWTWHNIWSSSDRVLGAQVYLMNQSGAWEESFNVLGDVDFEKAHKAFRADTSLPEPPVEDPPTPPASDLEARIAALENAQFVTKPQLQGYFEQLMNWVAFNFVAKNAFKGILTYAKEAVDKQNVESD